MAGASSSSAIKVSPRVYALLARVRGGAMRLGLPLLLAGLLLLWLAPDLLPAGVVAGIVVAGVVALVVSTPLVTLPFDAGLEPRPVGPPVRGRWSALNSPGTKVPSHGSNGYGQTYAFDLLHEPHDGARPEPRGLGFDPPERFPTFGQDVLAVADATVVACAGRARDHRCRARWPAYGYLFAEGMVRELLGVPFMFGNRVVLDLGDGAYAAYGHLQRGSIQVTAGQRVRAGDVLARAGNSGNSSEPHLHFQLMDHPKPLFAAGLPFSLPSAAREDRPTGVPADGEHLEAPDAPGPLDAGREQRPAARVG
jgi:hypothetical protein